MCTLFDSSFIYFDLARMSFDDYLLEPSEALYYGIVSNCSWWVINVNLLGGGFEPYLLLPRVSHPHTAALQNGRSRCLSAVSRRHSNDVCPFTVLQLNAFRNMRKNTPEECCSDPHGGPQLVNNYRPPLPLGNRVLRECGAM